MHDLGLGPPVVSERLPNATHKGPCFDGVYGCHVCWNHANDGKGTIHECEWCKKKDVHTLITRAWDEPVLYAVCAECRDKQDAELARMAREYESEAESNAWDDDDWNDDDSNDFEEAD